MGFVCMNDVYAVCVCVLYVSEVYCVYLQCMCMYGLFGTICLHCVCFV